MASSVLYLESYIDSTAGLPADFQRILSTIKRLDEESARLLARMKANVQRCQELPPMCTTRKDSPEAAQYAELQACISSDERLLVQFADEKVGLARQAADLLDCHSAELEAVLEQFESELQANQALDGFGMDTFGSFEAAPLPPRNRSGSKAAAAPTYSDADWGMGSTPLETAPSAKRKEPSRKRDRERERTRDFEMPAPSAPAPRSATQAMFDTDSRAESAELPAIAAAAAVVPPAPPPAAVVPEEVVAPPLQTFRNPPPPGFQQSARKPQGTGRLLVGTDINQSLPGRHAELYWPPEQLWYLVEIQSVDVGERNAIIMYYSGETEELDLDDIINTQHMRLLS